MARTNYKKWLKSWLVAGVIGLFSLPWALAYDSFPSLEQEQIQAEREVAAINASLHLPSQKHLKTTHSYSYYRPSLPVPIRNAQSLWPVIASHFSLGDYSNRPEVRHEILWFLSRRSILNMMLHNAVPYIYYVYQQTQQRGMPAEFALLPLVESGYDPFAYSQAGATGLWQMMPGTASSFGLDISWWYDSRRDTIVSTQAALNFLSSLRDMTHSWLLAAAAYDVGVGAVQAAQQYNIRSDRDTNFWDLPLPQETREYVPRLLALAEIIKNPAFYGVKLPYVPDHPYFAAINMNSQIDLAEASRFAEVPIDTIHRLNPGLLRWATNTSGVYTLLVPYESSTIFRKNLQAVAGKEHISWQYHEIRGNETLQSIAKNYHTSIDLLRRVNSLSSDMLTPNQGLLVPLYLHRTYSTPVATAEINPNTLQLQTIAPSPTMMAEIPTRQVSLNNPVKVDESAANDSLKTLLGKIYSQSSTP